MSWLRTLCLCLVLTLAVSSILEEFELKSEEGKKQYDMIKQDSQMPKYGTCWKRAIQDLESGCKKLTDDLQTRLALSFTNCFLAKIGRQTYACPSSTDISDCLHYIDSNAYATFTNFFTHTQNMCYFLQSQVWHDETKQTVVDLVQSSQEVSKRLEQNSKLHDKIIEAQVEVLRNDEMLLKNGEELKMTLATSKQSVIDVLDEFKSTTTEQRMALMEIFDRVSKLQSLFMGEFTGLYALLYYIAISAIAYLITSTSRTSGARFGIYVVLIINAAFERIVVNWGNETNELTTYNWIWWGRNIGVGACLIILALAAYWYQDYQAINNKILMEVRGECIAMKQNFSMLGLQNPFVAAVNGSFPSSLMPACNGNAQSALYSPPVFMTNGNSKDKLPLAGIEDDDEENDVSYEALSSSDDSSSSGYEDDTFETVSTAASSRPSTPPLSRQSTPKPDLTRKPAFSLNQSQSGTRKEIDILPARGSSPYGLRSRQRYSPQVVLNPVVLHESPRQFTSLIERMATLTKEHGQRVKDMVNDVHRDRKMAADNGKPTRPNRAKHSSSDSG